ncbi:MAG: zinc-ribbon domain-containing protein [Roseomonas sp.]|nr:zinc-ribbon domain-containing protein [Roseomonas sp.]
MLITCPNCEAGYQVPPRLLRDHSRPLRCGQCGMVFPIPELPAPAPVAFGAAEPPIPAPVTEEPRPASKPLAEEVQPEPEEARVTPPEGAASRGLRAAWAASIALLIGGGLAAIIQRDAVMEAWPPAARLFGALGLG